MLGLPRMPGPSQRDVSFAWRFGELETLGSDRISACLSDMPRGHKRVARMHGNGACHKHTDRRLLRLPCWRVQHCSSFSLLLILPRHPHSRYHAILRPSCRNWPPAMHSQRSCICWTIQLWHDQSARGQRWRLARPYVLPGRNGPSS